MKDIINRKKAFIITLLAMAAAVATACLLYIDYDKNTIKQRVDLYFMNEDSTGIVAESNIIRYKNDDELMADIIDEIRKGPSSANRGRIMSKKTHLNSLEFQGNKALVVDLSEEFLTDDSSKNVLGVYAITKSLCSTGKVQSVKVTVNRKPITDRDGNELKFVAASDINLETEEYLSEMREVVLYFANPSKTGLVKETRTITITDQQPVEQYIINELIKGPEKKSLKPLLSKNTVLMSVDLVENICYLNFKSNFLSENSGRNNHEKLVVYSIVNSLTELQTISRVQLYMDGKRVDKFGSIDIKDYIARDISIIDDKSE